MTTVDLSSASVEKVAERVLLKDGVIANPVDSDTNKFITLATSVRNIETVVRRTEATVNALATGGVDLDALAAKVADLLAARLAD